MTRLAFSLLLTLAAFSSIEAQGFSITGVVRDSASRQPISGAVISAVDSTGRTVSRSLSYASGEYRLLLQAPARRVQVVRLGFSPREISLPQDWSGTLRRDVAMSAFTMMLAPTRVSANARCPRRADNEPALSLYEQARAGLIATVVLRSERGGDFKIGRHVRRMDRDSDVVVSQEVQIDSVDAKDSFTAARGAGEFIRDGFTRSLGKKTQYFGPDAEVLLDDDFLLGYCLRVMDPVGHRINQVGIGFRAADRKPNRIDVDGALWIDTAARALVDIEYRFVGLSRTSEFVRPGGQVIFQELSSGLALVQRYHMRLATLRPDQEDAQRAAERGRVYVPTTIVPGDRGAEVIRVRWSDGTEWHAKVGTQQFNMRDAHGIPVSSARLHLVNTNYFATSDSSGKATFTDLLPGPYELAIVDPRLATIGLEVNQNFRFEANRDSTVSAALTVRTAEDSVIERCGGANGSILLIGRIALPDGRQPYDARWAIYRVGEVKDGGRPFREGATGADGLFQTCSANRGDSIRIEARFSGKSAFVVVPTLEDKLTVVPIWIP